MRTLSVALVGLLLCGACSDDLPDLKFDGGGGYYDGSGADLPPPPKLSKCEVVVTELMPAPANKDVEWIEILNMSGKTQDLAGLTIKMWHKDSTKADKVVLGKDAKTKLTAGGRLVVCSCVKGSTADAALGCYKPSSCKSISMVNSPDSTTGYTVQLNAGATEVHKVVYGKTGGVPKPKSGVSLRLAGELAAGTRCAESAKAKAWCTGPKEKSYDTAKLNHGTPGKKNGGCCFYKPRKGDLRVNEFMPNAPGPDDQNEWVELFVAAGPGPNGEVDLYGTRLAYGKTGTTTTALATTDGVEGCMRVKKGDFVLLTRKKKSTADTCTQTGTFNIGSASLSGTGGMIGLVDEAKTLEIAAKITYSSSSESTSVLGRAYSFDAAAKKWCWLAKDAANKYCTVTTSSSKTEEGYGTPKKANVACK